MEYIIQKKKESNTKRKVEGYQTHKDNLKEKNVVTCIESVVERLFHVYEKVG